MQGARNLVSAGVPSSTEARRELPLEPLPWPEAGDAYRIPHRHHCTTCGTGYDCDGPDYTGFCAPICPPCYWAALGTQLESFQQVSGELSHKRDEIERRVGIEACRRAEARRSVRGKTDAGLVVAMDTMLAHR